VNENFGLVAGVQHGLGDLLRRNHSRVEVDVNVLFVDSRTYVANPLQLAEVTSDGDLATRTIGALDVKLRGL